ncbi:hypothetical protein [Nonomuraea lactucae]|uniref:hypothetical protein n=1 Tax=Nonomuraea lactucae TaxID=2249762 RepID=UPI000DE4D4E4|nr:hypothetical protein [Nonomuraea lactucae]
MQQAVDAVHALCREEGLGFCKLTREQLTHFENGPGRPGEHYRDLLCRLYRTGPVQMGWVEDYSGRPAASVSAATIRRPAARARPHTQSDDRSVVDGGRDTMREAVRAALRRGYPRLAVNALDQLDLLRQHMDTILTSSTVSAVALDRWENAAEEYGLAFKYRPPREILDDLVLDFADLQHHAAYRQAIDSQIRICHISARLAALVGNILTDLGHHRHARNWFSTAQVAADETDDRALKCWVRAREAIVSLYHHRPPQIAITLATEAQWRAGRTMCAGAAIAAATEARGWARLGDRVRTLHALHRAEHIAGKLAGEALANSAFGYPTRQLAFHREAVLTLVDHLPHAQEAQREALALYPATEYVNPTLIRLDEAACVIRSGDRGSGYQKAIADLLAVPPGYRTPLVLSRAYELSEMAPPERHSEPTLRAYRETLAELSETDALPRPPGSGGTRGPGARPARMSPCSF